MDKMAKRVTNKEILDRVDLINKKIESLEKSISKLPAKEENKNYFLLHVFISLIFVMVTLTIPLMVQALGYKNEQLWWIVVPYFIVLFMLIFMFEIFQKDMKFKI